MNNVRFYLLDSYLETEAFLIIIYLQNDFFPLINHTNISDGERRQTPSKKSAQLATSSQKTSWWHHSLSVLFVLMNWIIFVDIETICVCHITYAVYVVYSYACWLVCCDNPRSFKVTLRSFIFHFKCQYILYLFHIVFKR